MENRIYNAIIVVPSHTSVKKIILVQSCSIFWEQSIQILIALLSILGYITLSHDILQAYLHSASWLTLIVYVKHKHLCKVKLNELLKPLKPLCELSDSEDYLQARMTTDLNQNLRMTPMTEDLAFFVKLDHGRLLSMNGSYVDDTIRTKDRLFEKRSRLTKIF